MGRTNKKLSFAETGRMPVGTGKKLGRVSGARSRVRGNGDSGTIRVGRVAQRGAVERRQNGSVVGGIVERNAFAAVVVNRIAAKRVFCRLHVKKGDAVVRVAGVDVASAGGCAANHVQL